MIARTGADFVRRLALLTSGLVLVACGTERGLPVLIADMPLHLEDHLADARVTGSVAPADAPQAVEWRFDGAETPWRVAPSWSPIIDPATVELTGEAMRITLTEGTRNPNGAPNGGIYVRVPSWDRGAWGDVVVRVRSDSTVSNLLLRVNLRDGRGVAGDFPNPFEATGSNAPVVRDGTVQTYRLRWPDVSAAAEVRELGIWFGARTDEGPGSVDLLSVSVSPIGETYRDPPLGIQQVAHEGRSRRAIYTHAPSRIEYGVSVPPGGRLDHAVRTLGEEPVTFRVSVLEADGSSRQLDEEMVELPDEWLQRSIDLGDFAGDRVTLVLETDADTPGTIGFWGAPTLSGSGLTTKPNVIFYVIDGGGADQMSLYGYNRRTTPNLEAIAAEGAVFEWAHSNASWSKPSTTGFMTSLQNSVLGNTRGGQFDPLPTEAKTMAERFREAGYHTAVLTSNPWAGSFAGLERGVDAFRDAGSEPTSRSSVELHEEFWEWRGHYPEGPYWVHFQTTDVHTPHTPLPPFAGLFAPIGAERALARDDSLLNAWRQANQARIAAGEATWLDQFEGTGVDRAAYFDRARALYDQALAHQDAQLGRLVERLKASGEWENTLLIVAADHGIEAGAGDFVRLLGDESAWDPPWAVLRSSVSRVPLVFVWPGRIPPGQRIRERVSMIDVFPTVLELTGLPSPDVLQGQSLAPLLLARPGWEPRPVIFDDFATDTRTGELVGEIEVIDGRWGASLRIGAQPPAARPRPSPLLLYDVYEDPMALHPVNERHPELVAKYTDFLTKQWEAHRLLARRFTAGGAIELTAEQLQTLRTLGYIR